MEYLTAIYALGLITFVMLFIQVQFTYATQGFAYGWSSNRSDEVTFTPLAKRVSNAYRNQTESITYTVPVLLVASLSGLESSSAETAALLIVVGRAIYWPLYYIGLANLRLAGFGLSTLATVYLLFKLGASGLI